MSFINNIFCFINLHNLDSNCKCKNCGKEYHLANKPKEERETDGDAYEDLPSRNVLVTRCTRCNKALNRQIIKPKPVPGVCYKCHKQVGDIFGDLLAIMAKKPYPCQSCGTQYCSNCIAKIIEKNNRICYYCGKYIGGYSIIG